MSQLPVVLDHCCYCCRLQSTTAPAVRTVAQALPRCRLPRGARGARCHRPPCARADRRLCAGTHDHLVSRRRGPPRRVLPIVAQCRDVVTRQATFRTDPIVGPCRLIVVHLLLAPMMPRGCIRGSPYLCPSRYSDDRGALMSAALM